MEHKTTIEPGAPTRIIRPFEGGGWFPVHNAVYDVFMPRLSPTAWKVLCVVLRQTWGWVARPGGDPRQRREWDRISYSQFQARTGIVSRSTISRALAECMDKGYLLRHRVGTERGQPVYVYGLNRELEIELELETAPASEPAALGIEPPAGPGNGLLAGARAGGRPVTGPENGPVAPRYPQVRPLAGTECGPVTGAGTGSEPITGTANGLITATATALQNRSVAGPLSGPAASPESGPVTPRYPQVRPLVGTEDGPVAGTGPQVGPSIGPGNGPLTGPGGGHTKQKRKQTQNDIVAGGPVDNSSEEEKDDEDERRSRSLELLMDAGVSAPQAWELSRAFPLEFVQDWVAYTGRRRGQLYNPPGFLISGLRSGKPPPEERSANAWFWEHDREELKRRYAPFPEIRT